METLFDENSQKISICCVAHALAILTYFYIRSGGSFVGALHLDIFWLFSKEKMTYRVFETNTFQRQLEQALKSGAFKNLDKKIRDYVYPFLRDEPHFGLQIKKLKDYTPETYRFRIGDFRLFYTIDEEKLVVVIAALRLRGGAY